MSKRSLHGLVATGLQPYANDPAQPDNAATQAGMQSGTVAGLQIGCYR